MGSNQSIMHSVPPTGLFLILIVQACTAGELSLPSLPEAVQLLQLETIRGLELTILGKEDENRRLEETILAKEDENQRLEEIIESVKIEKEAVTRQNIMMEEEMVQIISERESLIEELESRLQFLERDGTIGELEARIQGLEMEKSEIEKEIVMGKEENGQIMGAMESEKIQLRQEFVKKQTERDASCQLSTGCYRFHESPMTQSEARKFCEEEQLIPSHLVEIESAEENNAIIAEIRRRNFLSRKIEFWLGITDRHSEGRWVLESTGKSVVFTDWN